MVKALYSFTFSDISFLQEEMSSERMWRYYYPPTSMDGRETTLKTIWKFLKKLNAQFPCGPAVSLLVTNTRKLKTCVPRKLMCECS
jgi:hypothetical protein